MRLESCPHCGRLGTLHRSRSRNFKERMIKFFLPYKIYRCKECGWRGLVYVGLKEKLFSGERRKKIAKWQIYSFLILLLALVAFVFFYFEEIGNLLAPIFKEILQK